MLKQEPDSEKQPAAQIRVTKEEFARAIAALESRKQAEAQRLEGTVIIGDVLQQLQIDTPPEDVLREIKAIRQGHPAEEIPRRRFWNTEQVANAKLITGIVLVPLATIAMAVFIFNPLSSPKQTVTSGPMGRFLLRMPPPSNLPMGVTPREMDESGFNASSVLEPLSAVPDEQPIHCNTASLDQLFSQTLINRARLRSRALNYNLTMLAQSNQLFDVRPNLHKPWILIKHKGQLYFRAWVAAKFTTDQTGGKLVTFHSSPQSFDPGVQPVQITVPLEHMTGFGDFPQQTFGAFNSFLLATYNVRLDEHAWEKWQP